MKNIEHVCEGRDSRLRGRGYFCIERRRITVFLVFSHALLGCPFDTLGPALLVETGDLHELIDITSCPFCGVNLKELLASQNPPTSEAEAGNDAAH